MKNIPPVTIEKLSHGSLNNLSHTFKRQRFFFWPTHSITYYDFLPQEIRALKTLNLRVPTPEILLKIVLE